MEADPEQRYSQWDRNDRRLDITLARVGAKDMTRKNGQFLLTRTDDPSAVLSQSDWTSRDPPPLMNTGSRDRFDEMDFKCRSKRITARGATHKGQRKARLETHVPFDPTTCITRHLHSVKYEYPHQKTTIFTYTDLCQS